MSNTQSDNAKAEAFKAATMFVLVLAFVATVVYELAAPPERSISALIGEKFGQFSAARLDTQEEEEAQYLYHTRLADRQVDALMQAYTRAVEMNAKLVETAAEWEGKVLELQAKTLDQGNFMGKVGLNLSDTFCGLSKVSGDFNHPSCDYSDQMRRGMIKQYPQYLADGRTGMIEAMRDSLPSPGEILDPEYKRSRALFEASQAEDPAS